MKRIKANGIEIRAHEPVLGKSEFFHSLVVNDLDVFERESYVIIANRMKTCIDPAVSAQARPLKHKP